MPKTYKKVSIVLSFDDGNEERQYIKNWWLVAHIKLALQAYLPTLLKNISNTLISIEKVSIDEGD